MTTDDEARRAWLAIEAIVGDAEIELADTDDGDPALAPHEPTDEELKACAAEVAPADLAAQREAADALIPEAWAHARATKSIRRTPPRQTLTPGMTRLELLAMVAQLQAAHPGQFAQHYRNLDDMNDATLRALVEDMLALVDDEP
jgi:hypothetical protein